MRSTRKVDVGVEVMLMGKRFTINSEHEQMVDLLISTFEEVLRSRQREYEAKLSEETARESYRFLQSALDALSAQIARARCIGHDRRGQRALARARADQAVALAERRRGLQVPGHLSHGVRHRSR